LVKKEKATRKRPLIDKARRGKGDSTMASGDKHPNQGVPFLRGARKLGSQKRKEKEPPKKSTY